MSENCSSCNLHIAIGSVLQLCEACKVWLFHDEVTRMGFTYKIQNNHKIIDLSFAISKKLWIVFSHFQSKHCLGMRCFSFLFYFPPPMYVCKIQHNFLQWECTKQQYTLCCQNVWCDVCTVHAIVEKMLQFILVVGSHSSSITFMQTYAHYMSVMKKWAGMNQRKAR